MRFTAGYVSICTDFAALKATGLLANGEAATAARALLDNTGGRHVHHNGNMSMVVLSGIEGIETLASLQMITVTCYEDVFGYRQQLSIDGVLQYLEDEPVYENVLAVTESRTLYDTIYPRLPVVTPEGTYTPPALFCVPAGRQTDHLLADM